MGRMTPCKLTSWLVLLACSPAFASEPDAVFQRRKDVIYGRKDGTALTMDVFTPREKPNGRGVIWAVSGGWVSSPDLIRPERFVDLVRRGYTVFAVVHGSQPRYAIPDILQDQHRAVRFIRHHAKDFAVDPEHLGIWGGSSGGHLALMQGVAGDRGAPQSPDLVERESSRVQAVACFCGPTDFLNYGREGENALGRGVLSPWKAAFAFQEFDPQAKVLVPVTDEKKVREIGRQISPLTHVTADSAPTLIIHGDQDRLVPIQQSERFIARLGEVGVPARLVVKRGAGHSLPDPAGNLKACADWFDRHLAPKK
jgi:acetyl esterase/lipase